MASPEGIFFGPAGWSYPDWRGTVYPQPQARGFNPLAFLAGRFDFVEVNTSFYRVPGERLVQGWVDKTAPFPAFRFWVKLHRSFTHESKLAPATVSAFRAGLGLLAQAGKLAGLLAQFPYSFHRNRDNLAFLDDLAACFRGWPLAVEFRHQDWLEDEVIACFRERGLIWANIDQPQVSRSLCLTALATSAEAAYLRLHGRNAGAWFSGQGRDARYDYSYSAAELVGLGRVVARLKEQAKKVFVSGNNHFKGAAVRNLAQLKEIVGRQLPGGRESGEGH